MKEERERTMNSDHRGHFLQLAEFVQVNCISLAFNLNNNNYSQSEPVQSRLFSNPRALWRSKIARNQASNINNLRHCEQNTRCNAIEHAQTSQRQGSAT